MAGVSGQQSGCSSCPHPDASYRKLWAGREDNEHLMELIAGLDGAAGVFREHLYRSLEERYAATARERH